jgi:hypothetical protein
LALVLVGSGPCVKPRLKVKVGVEPLKGLWE